MTDAAVKFCGRRIDVENEDRGVVWAYLNYCGVSPTELCGAESCGSLCMWYPNAFTMAADHTIAFGADTFKRAHTAELYGPALRIAVACTRGAVLLNGLRQLLPPVCQLVAPTNGLLLDHSPPSHLWSPLDSKLQLLEHHCLLLLPV